MIRASANVDLVASSNGHVECVNELMAASAHVDLTDGEGSTPLSWASSNGHIECVNTLIAASATVDQTDGEGRTPLIWASNNVMLSVSTR